MAAASPRHDASPAPTPAARAAELAWRAVIEAQAADLDDLRRLWPDRTSAASLVLQARLKRRAAPDGDAERAVRAVHAAYGGAAVVPGAVRERMVRYVEEFLGRRPWPKRDLAERLDEPAVIRKRRRMRREGAQG